MTRTLKPESELDRVWEKERRVFRYKWTENKFPVPKKQA